MIRKTRVSLIALAHGLAAVATLIPMKSDIASAQSQIQVQLYGRDEIPDYAISGQPLPGYTFFRSSRKCRPVCRIEIVAPSAPMTVQISLLRYDHGIYVPAEVERTGTAQYPWTRSGISGRTQAVLDWSYVVPKFRGRTDGPYAILITWTDHNENEQQSSHSEMFVFDVKP